MPGEALFIGIATIAVVIAGFTAITTGIAPHSGAWDPGQRIRQRAIVSTSFNVMFESLAPPVAFAALGDAHSALLLSSVGAALYTLAVVAVRVWQISRVGALTTRSGMVLLVLGSLTCLLFVANALVFVSAGIYALALCVHVSVAAISFYTLVSSASS